MAFVQAKGNAISAGATTMTVAFTSNVTGGSRLVAFMAGAVAVTFSAPTDTLGNTWVQVEGLLLSRTQMWECRSSASGACTVTLTQSVGNLMSGWVMELSGRDSGAPDQAPTGTSASSASAAGAALTAAAADDLATGIFDDGGGSAAYGLTVGWTQPTGVPQLNGASIVRVSGAYQENVAGGSYTPTWTLSSAQWGVHDAAFKTGAPASLSAASSTWDFPHPPFRVT